MQISKPVIIARAVPGAAPVPPPAPGPWAAVRNLFRSVIGRLEALETRPAPAAGKDGIDGAAGRDGIDGRDGRDGINGVNGKDAPRIKAMTVVDGCLVIDFEDGGVINAGRVMGPAGEPGKDGNDGTPGRDGIDGRNGLDGKNGARGPRGERGIAGATPYLGILDYEELELTAGMRLRMRRINIGGVEMRVLEPDDE